MAKDFFHDAVKAALQKAGWRITHEPLLLKVGGIEMAADFGAETLLAAERKGQKIAVEVKSFVKPSAISEFHTALGQYKNYRRALKKLDPARILYLAVPLETYQTFFMLPFIQETILEEELKLIVYDGAEEVLVTWIN